MIFKLKYLSLNKNIALALVIFLLLMSCATQKTIYYWGKYPNTLYQYKKKIDEKSFDKHKKELEKIIKVSNRKSLRIAPGINAELGYMYLELGDIALANNFFEKEIILYPEASQFIKSYIEKLSNE